MPTRRNETRPDRAHAFGDPEPLPWLRRLRDAAKDAKDTKDQKLCSDMRFLVGSCRYPGTPFEGEASDAVFGGMLAHIDGTADGLEGVHMLFLIGDQIYADATANIADTRAWRERYAQRYRLAFTSANAQKVLARVPTHFAIDDHEIADNWSGADSLSEEYRHAMRSAKSFQSSGRDQRVIGPAFKQTDALWYPLAEKQEHCCPAFVMDTRSGRELRRLPGAARARLVTDDQLATLKEWLVAAKKNVPGAPKFIFCGVGIAPLPRQLVSFGGIWRSQDWWPGYPATLSDVLQTIVTEQVQHVVFVSGDLHLSSLSKLTLGTGNSAITAWQVVSSGLYAPMPFANAPRDAYAWNQSVTLPQSARCTVPIEATSWLLCSGQPHFLRVDAHRPNEQWELSVGVVGPTGAFLDPAANDAEGPPPGIHRAGKRWTVRL